MPTYCGVDLGHLGEALVHLLAGGNNLGRRGEGGGRGRRGRRGRGGGGREGGNTGTLCMSNRQSI